MRADSCYGYVPEWIWRGSLACYMEAGRSAVDGRRGGIGGGGGDCDVETALKWAVKLMNFN